MGFYPLARLLSMNLFPFCHSLFYPLAYLRLEQPLMRIYRASLSIVLNLTVSFF